MEDFQYISDNNLEESIEYIYIFIFVMTKLQNSVRKVL